MTEFVGSLPTKTPTFSGEALGDVLMCTCIIVITCCSGFVSILLSMSADGKRLNPRTSNSIYLFIYFYTVATICISPKSPKDHVPFIFSPRIIHRRCICVYLETHRRNIFWNFNVLIKLCGFWFIPRLTTSDILHRFREVPHVTLLFLKI